MLKAQGPASMRALWMRADMPDGKASSLSMNRPVRNRMPGGAGEGVKARLYPIGRG